MVVEWKLWKLSLERNLKFDKQVPKTQNFSEDRGLFERA